MICYDLMKSIDPKYNFIIYQDANDDTMDEFWVVAETEEEAQSCVESEKKQYANHNFHYQRIYR